MKAAIYAVTVNPEMAWAVVRLGADCVNKVLEADQVDAVAGSYLAIHAGLKFAGKSTLPSLRCLDRIEARATLAGWDVTSCMADWSAGGARRGGPGLAFRRADELAIVAPEMLVSGAFVAVARCSSAATGCISPWSAHRSVMALTIGDVVALPRAIPCRGRPGLWRPGPGMLAEIRGGWLETVRARRAAAGGEE